jgi:hypothetical protein
MGSCEHANEQRAGEIFDYLRDYNIVTWLEIPFGFVIGFINDVQVVTTITYNTVTHLHNLQSLHANILSLPSVVFAYSKHGSHTSLTGLRTPNSPCIITHTSLHCWLLRCHSLSLHPNRQTSPMLLAYDWPGCRCLHLEKLQTTLLYL